MRLNLSYEVLSNFSVEGHAGKLVFGTVSGKSVVCLQGRFHLYEGHGVHKVSVLNLFFISIR